MQSREFTGHVKENHVAGRIVRRHVNYRDGNRSGLRSRPDYHCWLIDRLSLRHDRRGTVRQKHRFQNPRGREHRVGRRPEALLRGYRRRTSGHYQRIASHQKSEVEKCAENGIGEIVEVKIGYDGIVLANSRKSPAYELSLKDIFLALTRDVPDGEGKTGPNPYVNWSDVNPDLPNARIEVLGPPPTSGTRDAFVELAMEGGCKKFDWVKALKKTDKNAYKALCHTIREDGAFVEVGENDNLIVKKLDANPNALGIFGFSFLDQNADVIQGSAIDGETPEFEKIADGSYPVSRSLYFYAKKAHIGVVPGIEEYLAEFTGDAATGEDGYLAEKGLIPMSDEEAAEWKSRVDNLANLSM